MPQCTARIVLLVALLPALVESDKFNAFYVKMQDYARLNAEQTETNAAQAQVIVDQGALVQECKTALEILNTTVQEQKVIIDSNMADIKALNMTADVAFHAVLKSYDTLNHTVDEAIKFDEVLLNEGNGYSPTTGRFTVPPGGAGLYYFSTYLRVDHGEDAYFDMVVNGNIMSRAQGDHNTNGHGDAAQAACSGLARLQEGDYVAVEYAFGADATPLDDDGNYYNGFNGFRLGM